MGRSERRARAQRLDTLQRALEERADQIPRYDRHEAARRTQQYRLAQSIAFTELDRIPHDDEMHLRLTQSVMDMVSHTEVGVTHFTRGAIRGNDYSSEVAVWVTPRLRMSFDVSYLDQELTNRSALATVPSSDRLYGITALWRHAVGETRVGVFFRSALADTTGFRIVHEQPLGPRLTGRSGSLITNARSRPPHWQPAVHATRSSSTCSDTLSKREYVLGHIFANRYYTQSERTRIGSAYGINWEAGHRFRTEYPDWHVRAAGSISHFSLNGMGDAATAVLNPAGTIPGASFFLPPSFATYGLYTGFGTFYRTNYTRALRPFLDVGLVHNTVTGNGYSALAGVSGSVAVADRLTLYFSTGRGGTGVNGLARGRSACATCYLFDHF